MGAVRPVVLPALLATAWDMESAGAAAPDGAVGALVGAAGSLAHGEIAAEVPDSVSGTAPVGEPASGAGALGVLGAASMPLGRRVPVVTALGHIGEVELSASSKNASVLVS
jgi:hypothetical protein